ncbi:hypothetical protein N9Z83_02680 [Akkermansiaceae bacterium]|nr:hypothetical protein [Akkermansiaceae bacterium]
MSGKDKKLAEGQKKYGVIISHGFQRRSEEPWQEAFEWIKAGNLGKLTLARGFCYKPRKSIGKVSAPVAPPKNIDYDLWSGPRKMLPIRRTQFHYDWHWQSPYGNGDLGNQGPHQLDVCRWALDDPMELPKAVLSAGGRLGYDDDGDTANTQVLYAEGGVAPILFEVRGLPKKGLDWKNGMPDYRGVTIGNVLEYEGGSLLGGHSASCEAVDKNGKSIKKFKGPGDHMHSWINACHSGTQSPLHNAENGHYSSAIAHMGTHALTLGKSTSQEEIEEALKSKSEVKDAIERMSQHLAANGLKDAMPKLGVSLTSDGKQLTGQFAQAANELDREHYRKGYTLPNA